MTVELVTRYAKIVIFFAVVWVIVFAARTQGCQKIGGPEMEPAIPRDSFRRTAPDVRSPGDLRRQDVVIYSYVVADRDQRTFAGRIFGLPGDRIRIVKGEVYVNDDLARSDFVPTGSRTTDELVEMFVPRDSVFVLGDNRRNAQAFDSRAIGPVGIWAIRGKVR